MFYVHIIVHIYVLFTSTKYKFSQYCHSELKKLLWLLKNRLFIVNALYIRDIYLKYMRTTTGWNSQTSMTGPTLLITLLIHSLHEPSTHHRARR